MATEADDAPERALLVRVLALCTGVAVAIALMDELAGIYAGAIPGLRSDALAEVVLEFKNSGNEMPARRVALILIRSIVIVTAVALTATLTDDLGASGALVAGVIVVVAGEVALSGRAP
jgi:hypothetical protein